MVRIYRSFAVIFCFAFFGIGALFIRYFIFPFQKDEMENYKTLQKSWQFFIWVIKTLKIISLDIEDIEKIRNIKNSIIVSTHPSFIDIVILMSIIPNSTCFVADKLANNPFFKGIVKSLFILEGQPMDVWVNDACDKLNMGLNIIIFPMGVRHRKNEFPRIRRGAALIAQKSHKNIAVIKMDTSFDFLQINQPIYEAGRETVNYTLSFIKNINAKDFINSDDVSFRTEITKQITDSLY